MRKTRKLYVIAWALCVFAPAAHAEANRSISRVVSATDGPHISDAILTNRTLSDWP